jgi:hypothetical protein
MNKKLLLVLAVCMQLPLLADLQSALDDFLYKNKEQYNDVVGYDLDFRVWKETRKNVKPGRPTLSFHGFGASPTTAMEWVRTAGPDKIPGDVVTLRFADAANDATMPDFRHINLGQKEDMLSAFMGFKCMQAVSPQLGWNTAGQSRGAAAPINALAVLNQPVDTWHPTLQESGISEQERLDILESIKKGVVILETPLVTTASGIQGNGALWIKKHTKKYVNLPERAIAGMCTAAHYLGFPVWSLGNGNYSPWEEQALASVDHLPLGLKVLALFEQDDLDVGNKYDLIFSQRLINRLGKENVWIVLGNDGQKELDDVTWDALQKAKESGVVSRLGNRTIRAHNAGSETLLKKGIISALYKKHGGAYVDDEEHLERGNRILDLARGGSGNLAKYFEDYDVNEKP